MLFQANLKKSEIVKTYNCPLDVHISHTDCPNVAKPEKDNRSLQLTGAYLPKCLNLAMSEIRVLIRKPLKTYINLFCLLLLIKNYS